MRRLAERPTIHHAEDAVDIVGTGGDGSGSVNISTGAALLTAAAGQRVIKHGNRAISSRAGSADVLESMGYTLPRNCDEAAESARNHRFTFLFAPYFHPAMRSLAPIRMALGVRTVFNVLGPLTNPAAPGYYLIGAFDLPAARLMADALSGMPIRRAFVVHGAPAWDEATPVGEFALFDVRPGEVVAAERDPADHAIPRCEAIDLHGGTASENAAALRQALTDDKGPIHDAIVINAALALEVTGKARDFGEGISRARTAIDDGSAQRLMTVCADSTRRSTRARSST
jgi:anthranilate phosphoribosyltransferase